MRNYLLKGWEASFIHTCGGLPSGHENSDISNCFVFHIVSIVYGDDMLIMFVKKIVITDQPSLPLPSLGLTVMKFD